MDSERKQGRVKCGGVHVDILEMAQGPASCGRCGNGSQNAAEHLGGLLGLFQPVNPQNLALGTLRTHVSKFSLCGVPIFGLSFQQK